ncbi:hypothetical protein CLJ1_6179 [Pseudomonas paraeruginosa]|nr:hypothetical protein CLJ1_6179 [Pseudomonas aeruginosa]
MPGYCCANRPVKLGAEHRAGRQTPLRAHEFSLDAAGD